MNRRGFLGAAGIILAAPAIVRADSLMRVVPVGETLSDRYAALTREKIVQLERQMLRIVGVDMGRALQDAYRTGTGVAQWGCDTAGTIVIRRPAQHIWK